MVIIRSSIECLICILENRLAKLIGFNLILFLKPINNTMFYKIVCNSDTIFVIATYSTIVELRTS